MPYRLPLCNADEVRAELADTRARLDRSYELPAVSAEHEVRREERRMVLRRWEAGLAEQLDEFDELEGRAAA